MSSAGVYLYRHIQTQQVLVSTERSLKSSCLKQLDIKLRPVQLRKDHWRPMVVLTGFNSPRSAQAVSDSFLHRLNDRQQELCTSKDHLQKPRRLRYPEEQNLVQKSIESLREALASVKTSDSKLLALWEQPRFIEMKGEGNWPEHLEHGQLLLKKNRFIIEPKETTDADIERA